MNHEVRITNYGIGKWIIILFLVFGAGFLVYAALKIHKPYVTSGLEREFDIPAGWTTKRVAESLEKEKLISQALFFQLYISWKGEGGKIQAGKYALSPAMAISQIAKILTSGQVIENTVRLTIVEGISQEEIAKILPENLVARSEDFLEEAKKDWSEEFEFLKDKPKAAGLEGFLFPDTYLLEKNSQAETVVRKMLANFDRKLTADLRNRIKDQGQTIYKIVTLASIIEREVGRNVKRGEKLTPQELETLKAERRLVASVLYNRLKIGKALESDATVTYITGSKSPRATLEETKIDSPYNTYRYAGLPPGPIANPSLDAILAAIEPAESDYLFFLTAPDGTAYFAETLEEHIRNRERYLE